MVLCSCAPFEGRWPWASAHRVSASGVCVPIFFPCSSSRGVPLAEVGLSALQSCLTGILDGDKRRLASLLLVNPVEVVELACEDPAWQPAIAGALGVTLPTEGDVSSSGEQATVLSGVLLDAVKRLKSPSWAYPTEVQGLLREAVARVTGGKHHSLEEVGGLVSVESLPMWGVETCCAVGCCPRRVQRR